MVSEVGKTVEILVGSGICPLKLLTTIVELMSYIAGIGSVFAVFKLAHDTPPNVRFQKVVEDMVRTDVLLPGTLIVVHTLKFALVPKKRSAVSVVVAIND